jgi:hypothetical protein
MFGQEKSVQNDNGAHQFLQEIMKILEYSGSNLKQLCIHKNDNDAHQCLLDTIRFSITFTPITCTQRSVTTEWITNKEINKSTRLVSNMLR